MALKSTACQCYWFHQDKQWTVKFRFLPRQTCMQPIFTTAYPSLTNQLANEIVETQVWIHWPKAEEAESLHSLMGWSLACVCCVCVQFIWISWSGCVQGSWGNTNTHLPPCINRHLQPEVCLLLCVWLWTCMWTHACMKACLGMFVCVLMLHLFGNIHLFSWSHYWVSFIAKENHPV